jgi:shikimate dehydrogenase
VNFLSHIVGAFADPIEDNPTVVMMEAAFRHHDLDWRYINCRVRKGDLASAVAGSIAMGWDGFNCSIPHKVAMVSLLDGISDAAKAIGAVNCITIQDGALRGDNTDGAGFVQSLRQHSDIRGSHMLILGAGGAARAIIVECARAGLRRLTICARSLDRAQEVLELARKAGIERVSPLPWGLRIQPPANTDIIVNATPVGLYPDVIDQPPLDLGSLGPDTVIADVIANPPVTALLRSASDQGLEVISGREMLVNQAARNITIWTAIDADTQVMRHALDGALDLS